MAWHNISGYLDKFFKITPPKKYYQNKVAEVINSVLNTDLKDEEVECRAGMVFVKIKNGALKNEIFLNKNKILEVLSEKLKNSSFLDIKF